VKGSKLLRAGGGAALIRAAFADYMSGLRWLHERPSPRSRACATL